MVDKTGLQTEIDLLATLERRDVVTEPALAKRLSISVGMVNALLKRAARKGLVKAKAAPYKRWAYYLTPEGFQEKSCLVAQYLDASLAFFRMARREYRLLFASGRRMGFRRFVLVGRGEVAEIALLAAIESDAELVGILVREANASRLPVRPAGAALAGRGRGVGRACHHRGPSSAGGVRAAVRHGSRAAGASTATPAHRARASRLHAAGGRVDREAPVTVSMTRSYVVHTRPHQGRRAEANLLHKGFRAWLPLMERSRRHRGTSRRYSRPCFRAKAYPGSSGAINIL